MPEEMKIRMKKNSWGESKKNPDRAADIKKSPGFPRAFES
jgi:hypothetical protein